MVQERWKRLLHIVGALFLALGLYALLGFFAMPKLLQAVVLPKVSAKLSGSISAARIEFNPFTARLKLTEPSLKDGAGAELFGAAEVLLDVEGFASIGRRGLIASADIAQPRVLLVIDEGGKLNFTKLAPPSPPEEKPTESGFGFLLERLTLRQGRLTFQDHANGRSVDLQWSPVDITLSRIGTLGGEAGTFQLFLSSTDAGTLDAKGNLALKPLSATGELNLAGANLTRYASYLFLPAAYGLNSANLGISGRYAFTKLSDKTEFDISGVQADLRQFALNRDGKPMLQFNGLTMADLAYQLSQQHLAAGKIALDGLKLMIDSAPPMQADGLSAESLVYQLGQQGLTVTSLSLDGFKLASDAAGAATPRLASLKVEKIATQLAARAVQIGSIQLQGMGLEAQRMKNGEISIVGVPASTKTQPAPAAAAKPAADAHSGTPWTFKVGQFGARDGDFRFEDQSASSPVAVPIKLTELSTKDLSTDLKRPIDLRLNAIVGDKGQVRIDGQVTPKPLTLELKTEIGQIDLSVLQPYLQDTTSIVLMRGGANLRGDIHAAQNDELKLRFNGSASVDDMITEDRREHREFLSWKRVDLNEIVFENQPSRLSIREVVAREPYGRVQIDPDRRLNLIENLAPPGAKGTTPVAASKPRPGGARAEPPMSVVISNFKVIKGRADFTDLTLKPTSFRSDIEDLDGTIRGLSSQQDAKADVNLDGHIDQNSPVHIGGHINPFRPAVYTDIVMSFRDINLTSLSPYSGKFAGYRIEKGKLDMDLRYRLNNNLMEGDNKFVMDHLELGEKVDSPDATSLPIRLAIALLKDANGRIDLRIPISGDLSSPKVSIGGLLVAAFTQVLTKLVSSPVAILGSLVPDGTKDLDAVGFPAGSAELAAAEKTKLGKIAGALKTRGGLNLEIAGEADRKTDRPGVAEQALLRQLLDAKRAEQPNEPEPASLSDKDYRRLFTRLYRQRQPNAPEFQGMLGGPSVLDGAAFEQARQRYLQSQTADDEALRRLAKARGEAIRQFLIQHGGLTTQQIYLLDAKVVDAEEKPVGARLSIGT